MKLDAYFTAYTKLTQKGSKTKMWEPNLKLLEENIGEKFHDSGFGNDS